MWTQLEDPVLARVHRQLLLLAPPFRFLASTMEHAGGAGKRQHSDPNREWSPYGEDSGETLQTQVSRWLRIHIKDICHSIAVVSWAS